MKIQFINLIWIVYSFSFMVYGQEDTESYGKKVLSNVNDSAQNEMLFKDFLELWRTEGLDSCILFPQFPGGKQKFIEYFHKSIKYPLSCQQKNQEGKVTCHFDVYRDGHISNMKITQKAVPEMDKEVLRVISNMPQWTFASESLLSPVFSRYTVTVIFRINGTEYGKDTSENEIVVIGYGASEKPVIVK